MKKDVIYSLMIGALLFMVSCGDINEFHDEYLKKGENIYIARVDSVDAFAGDQRVLLRLYTKNPGIASFTIFWDQKGDSLVVPVQDRTSPDYLDVLIGKNSKTLTEKSYVFDIYSRDNKGHRSIKYEQIAEVYGDRYRSNLQNHYIKSTNYNSQTSDLTVNWFSSIDKTEIAVEFKYYSKETGEPASKIVEINDLGNATVIPGIDTSHPVTYRTLFLPEPTAIDTFYTDFAQVEVVAIINVALNRPVVASDILNASYPGSNAVDGINNTNASRWVSTTTGEHWIEIDLGQEYNVFSFKTWTGSNGTFGYPNPAFKFQAYVNDVLQDIIQVTGNTNSQYEVTFPEVKTSKVRYSIPAGVVDNVRLYEIAVYARLKY